MPRTKKAIEHVEDVEEYQIQPGDLEKARTSNERARINLGELLSQKPDNEKEFRVWLEGTTPLICHAWSLKAKLEMLRKQTGATQLAKAKRDPDKDFLDSLYDMDMDNKIPVAKRRYGFPVMAVKAAVLSNAHVKRGVAKTDVMAALWLDAEQVQTRPAISRACCDMPLVRLWGSPPEMREDMVRIGSGARKIANLAYRAQFTTWAVQLTGTLNTDLVPDHALAFLFAQAGKATGVGDWRNEKGGWFGAFQIAIGSREKAWDDFAAGKGPLPESINRAVRRDLPVVKAKNGRRKAA